ncbi:MAG: GDSL-type esterase/lipase family protein [Candidatus Heteroscillospira sp.]|jgi:lysophospholipase L1-like esterase
MMNKFSRLFALLLALSLLAGLGACSKREVESEPPATPAPETSAPDTTAPETAVPETPAPETTAPETAVPETPAPGTPAPETAAPETAAPGTIPENPGSEDYLDRLTFLGDSTTYGLKAYAMLSGGKDTQQVWTPSSGTLTLSNQSWATIVYPATGEEIPIRDAVTAAKPDIMVITLGVNGVSFLTEDGFKSEYKALVNDIKELSPDTKIICNSIYPVESDYQYLADINNDKISKANGWIAQVAADCGVNYLDTYSLLLGADGFLNESYGNGDGIHLGPAGFEIVLQNLRDHAI